MSDLSGIGFLAALLFLFAVFLSFIKGVIDRLRNRNKQSKNSVNEPIINDSEDDELSREDNEFDGEMLFDDPMFPPEDFDDEN